MSVLEIANLVHQTSTDTGLGNFTLTAVNGKQTFDQAFGHGSTQNVFFYFISNESAGEWEEGTGHLSNATTLVRDTVQQSSNANAAVNFTAGTKDVVNDLPSQYQVSPATGTARTLLTQDTTYYVATTGSDSTGTGTVGNPWATIQHAWDTIASTLDIGAFVVTIQLADGTYSESPSLIAAQTGQVVIQGNLANQTSVVLTGV